MTLKLFTIFIYSLVPGLQRIAGSLTEKKGNCIRISFKVCFYPEHARFIKSGKPV